MKLPIRRMQAIHCTTGIILLATACGRGEKGPGEDGQGEKIILVSDYQTRDGLDFKRLNEDVKRYTKAPHADKRPAKIAGRLVDVDIASSGKSWDVKPLSGPGARRIIGYMKNKDAADTEAMYSLLPNSTYNIFVENAPMNATGKSRTVWGLQYPDGSFKRVGYVVLCHKDTYDNKKSDVNFFAIENCPPSTTTASVGTFNHASLAGGGTMIDVLMGLFRVSRSALNPVGSTWFECDPGCCSGTSSLDVLPGG